MHGVKRVDDPSKLFLEPTHEEIEKLTQYRSLCQQFETLYFTDANGKGLAWAREMFACTQRLLHLNPEYYTAWNERKLAIAVLHNCGPNSPEETMFKLSDELTFNVACIRANPKSYCSWQHRRWLLSSILRKENARGEGGVDIVKGELVLLDALLKLDCRNFHGWNYRIWLADFAQLSVLDEFDFTTCKIYENFSNYSAWQRRAHLLPAHLAGLGSEQERTALLRNEAELSRSAAWTEPKDQSVWFYQRWFFSQLPDVLESDSERVLVRSLAQEQIVSVEDLIREEPSAALAHAFLLFMLQLDVQKRTENEPAIRALQCQLVEIDPLRKGHWMEQQAE